MNSAHSKIYICSHLQTLLGELRVMCRQVAVTKPVSYSQTQGEKVWVTSVICVSLPDTEGEPRWHLHRVWL